MSQNSLLALKKEKAIQYFNENDLDNAEKYLKQVCKKSKIDAESWYLLGLVCGRKENHVKAEKYFRHVIKIEPNILETYINLAVSLNIQAKHEECAKLLSPFVKQHPNEIDALINLSIALLALKRPEPVIKYALHAVDLAHNNSAAHETLASAYTMLNMFDEAAKSFETALQLDSRNIGVIHNYAKLTLLKHEYDHCIELCEKALDIKPSYSPARRTLFSALIKKGHIKKSLALAESVFTQFPEEIKHNRSYLFNLNYDETSSPEKILHKHQRWGNAISLTAKINTKKKFSNITGGRKIRIGYVSPDFRKHSVAYFLEPLLKHHDKNEFEIFCYSNVKDNDDVTEHLKNYTDQWLDIYKLNDQQVTKQVIKDKIDILVDLAGHSKENRLNVFIEKPAPIQITYLGYPSTTGLPSMGYRLVDENTDPSNSENFATEKLLRIPDCFLCYSNNTECEPESTKHHDSIVFGSFNNLPKINAQVIATWAEIMNQIEVSKLFLKSRSFSDNNVCEDYLSMFEKHGITRNRITMVGLIENELEHMQCYNNIDIALDTFPYNGTTTTCEALWMGVPVICFSGDRHASRVSSSLLHASGLSELVAKDRNEYIEKAVALAKDTKRLHHYRTIIRNKMLQSPLCDAKSFAKKIEHIYQNLCHPA